MLITGFVAIGLIGIAVAAIALVAWQRYENTRSAWPARLRLAQLANELENDDQAPDDLRARAIFCADHAFDTKTLKRIRRMVRSSQRPSEADMILRANEALERDGQLYTEKSLELSQLFVQILLFEGIRYGWLLRREDGLIREDARPVNRAIDNERWHDRACAA